MRWDDHCHWERVFGQKVKSWRKSRRWSQAELALALGNQGISMHQTTIGKIEAGSRPLRVAEASAIAAAFGLQPLAIFWDSPHAT